MRDRDSFFAKESKPEAKTPTANLKIMIRDAVHVNAVTHDEHWDRFLSFLQAGRNQSEKALEAVKTQVVDVRMVNHEHILQAKMELAKYEAMVTTLKWVMELPKSLMTNGDKARELMPKEEE